MAGSLKYGLLQEVFQLSKHVNEQVSDAWRCTSGKWIWKSDKNFQTFRKWITSPTATEMTPFDDFVYLINSILLGEEPTVEDFILLIGTFVAFVAFILWCCFPIVPKESGSPSQYDSRHGQGKRPPNSSSFSDSYYDEKS